MQEYVELISKGYTLRGFLHRPEPGAGKIPMVIMYHGYSASKTNSLYVEMARLLEKEGIASLRFDFMGSGDSDGLFQDMSIETEILDGINILRYARELPFVDPERVALVGTSYGGLAAAIIAARCPDEVRALGLWCPAVISIIDAKAGRAGRTDITAVFSAGTADVDGLLVGRRFLEDNRALDFDREAPAYQNRVLLIWGDKDPIVPPEIVTQIEHAYGSQLEKHMIPGVGHMFETRPAREGLMKATKDFLLREFA